MPEWEKFVFGAAVVFWALARFLWALLQWYREWRRSAAESRFRESHLVIAYRHALASRDEDLIRRINSEMRRYLEANTTLIMNGMPVSEEIVEEGSDYLRYLPAIPRSDLLILIEYGRKHRNTVILERVMNTIGDSAWAETLKAEIEVLRGHRK